MFTAFSTALSGLNAMTTAIDVVGNNLANLNTTGYKNQSVSFEDLVAQSLSGNESTQIGLGTSQPSTSAQFIQGAIQTTNGSFDGAINGAGFFVVKNSDGQDLYTRAGDFQVDKNGYLVTQTGERVQGWVANSSGVVNPSGALNDIQVPVGQALSAQPTTAFSAILNLNSSTAPGATWSTGAINVIDSLGNSVPLNVTFTKDPLVAGQWNYNITGTGTTVTGGSGSLQFDNAGNLTTPSAANGSIPLSLSGFTDGSANMAVNWNLYGPNGSANISQYSEASNLSGSSQNGQPAAVLTGVSLQNGGKIMATYSNGAQQQVVAQLSLASIRNPQSLQDVGNNNFELGADSATPTIGASGAGGLGVIDGGAVESSTVDIATEFSNLLTYERSYQANSRVVTVSDELAQDAVNLVK
jgi:flagellar hook protein FlgE